MRSISLLCGAALTGLFLWQCSSTTNTIKGKPTVFNTTECLQDFTVVKGTVELWKRNWEYVLEQTPSVKKVTTDNTLRAFARREVNKLLVPCFEGNCQKVRIYFGVPDGTTAYPTTPNLYMVRVGGCLDSDLDSILVSSSSNPGENEWKTGEEVAGELANWRTLSNAGYNPNNEWSYDTVYAYTYESRAIVEMLAVTDSPDLNATLCMHAGGVEGPPSANQGSLILDVVLVPSIGVANDHLDFALPCPKYCGPPSMLNGQANK